MFSSEYDMRQAGSWDESRQTVTTTICPYCGVGCNLELHAQDNRIVKVTSPLDHDVSHGHLCVKGTVRLRVRPAPGPGVLRASL
jgi:predicted molibdopterin-dependent oxidoreductase YjgC